MNDLTLYEKVRKEIKPGDHLGFRTFSPLGSFIRMFSGDTINHSEMAITLDLFDESTVYTIGANADGVWPYLLSHVLSKYTGNVWWYPLKDEFDELREPLAKWAYSKRGTKYDFKGLIGNAFRRVPLDDTDFYCSEFFNIGVHIFGFPIPEKYKKVGARPHEIDQEFDIFKDKVHILKFDEEAARREMEGRPSIRP